MTGAKVFYHCSITTLTQPIEKNVFCFSWVVSVLTIQCLWKQIYVIVIDIDEYTVGCHAIQTNKHYQCLFIP